MYSVIIPTMWKSNRIHQLLYDLDNCSEVGEIILIDNMPTQLSGSFSKLRHYPQTENQYVGPSWNLGVSYALYENICLCSDDINFNTSVFSQLNEHIHKGVIGPGFNSIESEGYPFQEPNQEIGIQIDRAVGGAGWGCLLFFQKSKFIPLPSTNKIAFGDTFLARTIDGGAWDLNNFKVTTEMSTTTRLPEFLEIIAQDIEYKP